MASQGALDSALTYLGPSDNPELAELRDRLYYALGYKKQAQQQAYARGSLQPSSQAYQYGRPPAPGNRFGQRNSITNPTAQPAAPLTNNFNTGLPGAVNAPSQPPLQPWKPPAPVSTFNPMQPQAVPLTSMPPMPPGPLKPPTINDGIIQPPRPSSVGSQGSMYFSKHSQRLMGSFIVRVHTAHSQQIRPGSVGSIWPQLRSKYEHVQYSSNSTAQCEPA